MFKYLKKIFLLKDIRKEENAQGVLENVFLSRKFWGMIWIAVAIMLKNCFDLEFEIDPDMQESVITVIVDIVSALMVLFGLIMQGVSYIKTIRNQIEKRGTGIKSLIILLMASALLAGCSLAADSIKDVDKHIAEITKAGDGNSVECVAGFYMGISFGTDNLKITKAAAELDALIVDKKAEEYMRCKAKGLEISILAIAGQERFDDVVGKIIKLGLVP